MKDEAEQHSNPIREQQLKIGTEKYTFIAAFTKQTTTLDSKTWWTKHVRHLVIWVEDALNYGILWWTSHETWDLILILVVLKIIKTGQRH